MGCLYSQPVSLKLETDLRTALAKIFGLRAWCLTIGRLPHFSLRADRVAKPLNVDNNQTSDWLWQTEHGVAPEQPSQQSSDVRPIFTCFCTLSEIIHSSLYVLYTPTSALNSTDILNIYTRYLEWYGRLPDALRVGGNPSPAALFIQYAALSTSKVKGSNYSAQYVLPLRSSPAFSAIHKPSFPQIKRSASRRLPPSSRQHFFFDTVI